MKWSVCFRLAIVEHDKQAFNRLLRNVEKTKHKQIDERDEYGMTPLMLALRYISARHGLYFVNRLIKEGADVNAKDDSGFTVFAYAINREAKNIVYDILRLLLQHGLASFKTNEFIKLWKTPFMNDYIDYINRYQRIFPLLLCPKIPLALCIEIHRFLD